MYSDTSESDVAVSVWRRQDHNQQYSQYPFDTNDSILDTESEEDNDNPNLDYHNHHHHHHHHHQKNKNNRNNNNHDNIQSVFSIAKSTTPPVPLIPALSSTTSSSPLDRSSNSSQTQLTRTKQTDRDVTALQEIHIGNTNTPIFAYCSSNQKQQQQLLQLSSSTTTTTTTTTPFFKSSPSSPCPSPSPIIQRRKLFSSTPTPSLPIQTSSSSSSSPPPSPFSCFKPVLLSTTTTPNTSPPHTHMSKSQSMHHAHTSSLQQKQTIQTNSSTNEESYQRCSRIIGCTGGGTNGGSVQRRNMIMIEPRRTSEPVLRSERRTSWWNSNHSNSLTRHTSKLNTKDCSTHDTTISTKFRTHPPRRHSSRRRTTPTQLTASSSSETPWGLKDEPYEPYPSSSPSTYYNNNNNNNNNNMDEYEEEQYRIVKTQNSKRNAYNNVDYDSKYFPSHNPVSRNILERRNVMSRFTSFMKRVFCRHQDEQPVQRQQEQHGQIQQCPAKSVVRHELSEISYDEEGEVEESNEKSQPSPVNQAQQSPILPKHIDFNDEFEEDKYNYHNTLTSNKTETNNMDNNKKINYINNISIEEARREDFVQFVKRRRRKSYDTSVLEAEFQKEQSGVSRPRKKSYDIDIDDFRLGGPVTRKSCDVYLVKKYGNSWLSRLPRGHSPISNNN